MTRPGHPGRVGGTALAHDGLFREVFGVPADAASLLRTVLPPELAERLDLDGVTECPGDFVDADLQRRQTDVLLRVPVIGNLWFVYVLLEHQSSADRLMPLRILGYTVRIWESYIKVHPEATRLPAVIPIVVHHDRNGWKGSTSLDGLYDLDADTLSAARDHLPRLRFLLYDLAGLDEEVLRRVPLTTLARIALLLLKVARDNPDLIKDLYRWVGDLEEILDGANGIQRLRTLLTYINVVADVPAEEFQALMDHLGSEAKEAYMTIAEQHEARGEVRGQARLLVEILTRRFGPLGDAALDAINAASAEQLREWGIRFVTADTLDEVFAGRTRLT